MENFDTSIKNLQFTTFFNVLYNDDFTMPIHSHNTYEIMYVKKGQMKLAYQDIYSQINKNQNKDIVCNNHKFVIINSAVPHKLIIEKGMSCNLLNIELIPNKNLIHYTIPIKDYIMSINEFNNCESVQNVLNNDFSVLCMDDSQDVGAIISSIHKMLNNPTHNYENEYLTQLLFRMLILNICKCQNLKHQITGNIHIKKTLNYIEKYYQKNITISDIASELQLDKSYLQRLIKKTLNRTIMDLLQEYRIEKAKGFLADGVYTISEICDMVGFNNRQTFSKNFIKYCNISPQKYRSDNKNKYFRHYFSNNCHIFPEINKKS